MGHYYERVGEDFNLERCPGNDLDGSVTGHIVFGVNHWFDEHPEERIRLGWIKHITTDEDVDYDEQTQYVVKTVRKVDEYTVEDVYHVLDKSEEVLRVEEILESMGVLAGYTQLGGLTFFNA